MEKGRSSSKMGILEPVLDDTAKSRHIFQGEVLSCTDGSQEECFKHLLFATNKVYAPGFMRIKKGFLLFLLNLDSQKLYGVFRATTDARATLLQEFSKRSNSTSSLVTIILSGYPTLWFLREQVSSDLTLSSSTLSLEM